MQRKRGKQGENQQRNIDCANICTAHNVYMSSTILYYSAIFMKYSKYSLVPVAEVFR